MNTFLPCGDYAKCAYVLDSKRLNRQLTEGIQVCRILVARKNHDQYAWMNHPVHKLWTTSEGKILLPELVAYLDAMSEEWHSRPSCRKRHTWLAYRDHFVELNARDPGKLVWPDYVHVSMRRNLLRKDPTHYRHYFRITGLPYDEEPMEGYFWEHPKWEN